MNDSEKVRSVVAKFFNVPESAVTDSFVFPPDRLQWSLARCTLHAALKRMAGVELPSVWTATTFAQLLNGTAPSSQASSSAAVPSQRAPSDNTSVGIDVELVENLPWSADPWTEPFFVENFNKEEIAYCVRQPNPRLSLCGLWCAKEAAIKCGPPFAGLLPKQIEIFHDEHGRPSVRTADSADQNPEPFCDLSISHAGQTVVAICVRAPRPSRPDAVMPTDSKSAPAPSRAFVSPTAQARPTSRRLVLLCLLASAAALALSLWNLINR